MNVCTKENPMPTGTKEKWMHPDSIMYGTTAACGDSSAIGYFKCRICDHDYLDINIKVPEGAPVQ